MAPPLSPGEAELDTDPAGDPAPAGSVCAAAGPVVDVLEVVLVSVVEVEVEVDGGAVWAMRLRGSKVMELAVGAAALRDEWADCSAGTLIFLSVS